MYMANISREISITQRRLLARAQFLNWPLLITGFLTNARFASGSLMGVVWLHSKAGLNKDEFSNGHLIITSVIVGVREYGEYWIVETLNSFYVVIDFAESPKRLSEVIAAFPRLETIH